MSLTGPDVSRLVDELNAQLDDARLQLLATDLDVDLNNMSPGGSVKERAYTLISHLNGLTPPRDRQLLEMLAARGNARLKQVAGDLLKPTFVPTGDPHDAVLLGKVAFIARDGLRKVLRDFTNPSQLTTRVLIVRGDDPGGKSYSWEFLRHLAFQAVNAQAVRLRTGLIKTPRELLRQALVLLGLSTATLPFLTDDPQLSRVDELITSFKGEILTLTRKFWLVIDDLNEPAVTPAIRETAFAMAQSVEELKPQNLWLALLGYNETIVDPELRYVAQDDAKFPGSPLAAKYLKILADMSPTPLTQERAQEIADVMFSQYPKLTKEAMTRLTISLEQMGAKLVQGVQP